jgi:hypothetical protein
MEYHLRPSDGHDKVSSALRKIGFQVCRHFFRDWLWTGSGRAPTVNGAQP